MRRGLLFGLVVAAAGCGGGRVGRPASLLRCQDNRSAPCLSVRATFTPQNAVKLMGVDPADRGTGWRALFRGDSLIGTGAPATTTPVASRVLVLVDVSGSMKGSKIGAARLVLRQFLGSLDSLPRGSVRVAVAPFGSANVAGRIGNARFEPPDSAGSAINGLPNPNRENTALYSAVTLGIHRLNDEVERAGSATVGLLAVLTDGNNEIRPGDDLGLLAGESGLVEAARAVSASPAAIGILGIGNLDRGALDRLAGSRGRVFPISGNPSAFDLARPLATMAGVLQTSWLVNFPVPAAGRSTLARGFDRLEVGLELGGELVPAGVAIWKAPAVALPAFAGTVPAAVRSPVIGPGRGGWVGAALVAAVLLILMLEVWLVVPRMVWGAGAGLPPGPAPTGVVQQPSKRAPEPAGRSTPIRADLTEAPPRKPSDVTASRARSA